MSKRSKVFVVLSFIVALVYSFELISIFNEKGLSKLLIPKALIVVLCLVYGVSRLKSKTSEK